MANRQKISELFSREEIAMLTARSDLMGAWGVLSTWAVIALTFAVIAWSSAHLPVWAMVPMVGLALIVLGGRQLALAILQHEGAHGTLFKTKWCNDVLADWLCAQPVGVDLHRYRAHHRIHHTKTGTLEDSDISLSAPFPTSRASLARKFARDLTGISGLKRLFGLFLMNIGILKWTVANDVEKLPQQGRRWTDYARDGLHYSWKTLLSNMLLLTLLALSGYAWLYLLWAVAYLTTFSLFMRIRSLAEHACTEMTPNMFRNTRTTRAGWLARATVAPMHVNYHIEHHVMASVPYFRLPALHRMLRQRGAVEAPPSYLEVLAQVTRLSAPA